MLTNWPLEKKTNLVKMVKLPCGNTTCQYETPDLEMEAAMLIFKSHLTTHTEAVARPSGRAERMKRPPITTEISMQDYSFFLRNWALYKKYLDKEEITTELLACCDEELRGNLFRTHSKIEESTEKEVLEAIKTLAVKKESVIVAQVNHFKIRQERDEPIPKYFARLKGQASICDYTVKFKTDDNREHTVSYEDKVLRQIMAANMADPEIQRDLLSRLNNSENEMTADEMVKYIEGKENGKESVSKLSNLHSTNALHSTYKKSTRPPTKTYSQAAKPLHTTQQNSQERCSYCGTHGHGNVWGKGSAHIRKKLGCPAYDKTCSKCSKIGHYTTMCKMMARPRQYSAAAKEGHSQEDYIIGGAIGINQQ